MVASRGLFSRGSKIVEVLKTKSWASSIAQAITYFTVNRCFKTRIIVDDLSFTVG